MQVNEEAMYSMRNNLPCKWMKKLCILCGTIYMQVDEEAVFYAEQSTKMKKPCILCGTIYMQVDEEAMYSMRNNLRASG